MSHFQLVVALLCCSTNATTASRDAQAAPAPAQRLILADKRALDALDGAGKTLTQQIPKPNFVFLCKFIGQSKDFNDC